MAFDDSLADGETDAGTGVFLIGVESIEHVEDALPIVRIDPDALVADRDGDSLSRRSDVTSIRGGSSPL